MIGVILALTGCRASDFQPPEDLAARLQSQVRANPDVLHADIHFDEHLYFIVGDVELDPNISDKKMISLAHDINGYDVGSFWPDVEDVIVAQHVGGYEHFGSRGATVTAALRKTAHCVASKGGFYKVTITSDTQSALTTCFEIATRATGAYNVFYGSLTVQTADGAFSIAGAPSIPSRTDLPVLRPTVALKVWDAIASKCRVIGAAASSVDGPDAQRLRLTAANQSDLDCINRVALTESDRNELTSFTATLPNDPVPAQ